MSFKPAIASMSLGRAWVHSLPSKLSQAAAHNLHGIEIFFEDLEYLAREQSNISADFPPSPEAQLLAAQTIQQLCDEFGLTIIGLQPFMHYEGLIDRNAHESRIEKLKLWFKIAAILKTDIIQIPANFLPKEQATGDMDVVVKDLQQVADMGLQESPVIKFAYKNLCWSTYFDTWEQGWEIVTKVNRANFGLCLDTYNIAGRVYGDPASATGKTPHAEEDMKKSLERLIKTVDVTKVYYIQVVDAEKMRDPLVKGHAFYSADQPARMSWSRNARLFAFEERGYLPIVDVTRAIIQGLGYKGWISMELFSRTMADPRMEVPTEHATRAAVAWEKIQKHIDDWISK